MTLLDMLCTSVLTTCVSSAKHLILED